MLLLTNIFADKNLIFNNLGLVLHAKMLERERELNNPSSCLTSYLFSLFGLWVTFFRKLFSVYSCIFIFDFFSNKDIYSLLSELFRVTDLFFCCRSKSARTKGLPVSQLCPVVVCRDYTLLPFFCCKFFTTTSCQVTM